jgi:hypothetical protein
MLPNCDNSTAVLSRLWPISTNNGNGRSNAAKDLYLEVANFLAQCVAIDTQQVGCPDLVSARGCERHR